MPSNALACYILSLRNVNQLWNEFTKVTYEWTLSRALSHVKTTTSIYEESFQASAFICTFESSHILIIIFPRYNYIASTKTIINN